MQEIAEKLAMGLEELKVTYSSHVRFISIHDAL